MSNEEDTKHQEQEKVYRSELSVQTEGECLVFNNVHACLDRIKIAPKWEERKRNCKKS